MAYEALNNLGHSRSPGRDRPQRQRPVLRADGVTALPEPDHAPAQPDLHRGARAPAPPPARAPGARSSWPTRACTRSPAPARDGGARTPSSRRSGVRYAGPIDGHDIEHMEQAFTTRCRMGRPHRRPRPHAERPGLRPGGGGRDPAPARRQGHQADHAGERCRQFGGAGRRRLRRLRQRRRGLAGSRRREPREAEDRPTGRHLHRCLLAGAARAAPRRTPDRRADRRHAGPDGPVGRSRPGSPTASSTSASPSSTRSTAAAGMAMAGLRPVVAVYSTFWSRAFDQANLDVGLHGCPGRLRLRPGRHHRRRRPEPPRRPRPGPRAVHPRHDGLRPVGRRGGRADAAGPRSSSPGPPPSGSPRARPGTSPLEDAGSGLEAKRCAAGDGSVCLLGVGKSVGACARCGRRARREGSTPRSGTSGSSRPPDRGDARRRRTPPARRHRRGRCATRRCRRVPHRRACRRRSSSPGCRAR